MKTVIISAMLGLFCAAAFALENPLAAPALPAVAVPAQPAIAAPVVTAVTAKMAAQAAAPVKAPVTMVELRKKHGQRSEEHTSELQSQR